MVDLLLIAALGFLGSFGHCLGMCGPLTAAFSMANSSSNSSPSSNAATLSSSSRLESLRSQLAFNLLLNLGRMASYALVGAAIGALGSVLLAGGQLAGMDSGLRQGVTTATGVLLIWFGLSQINIRLLPHVPFLHPLLQGNLHDRLSHWMAQVSRVTHWWTPLILGLGWGFIPCGFLYAAQIKAAATGNLWQGALTMIAFGLGTLPMMLGVGVSTAFFSRDRRSQLFQLGGWLTLLIGILMVFRSSEMVDYTGHGALLCVIMALIARPLSHLWSAPLRYRRALGVGGFVLSWVHVAHAIVHTFNWQLQGIFFQLPAQQAGLWSGVVALGLMTPAALTSCDRMVQHLGNTWRKLHLLSVPALVLAIVHTGLAGSSYWGGFDLHWSHHLRVMGLAIVGFGVLLIRSGWVWSLFSLKKFYVSAKK